MKEIRSLTYLGALLKPPWVITYSGYDGLMIRLTQMGLKGKLSEAHVSNHTEQRSTTIGLGDGGARVCRALG